MTPRQPSGAAPERLMLGPTSSQNPSGKAVNNR
jgi:hypothetical protein